jgi:hypothetical protein
MELESYEVEKNADKSDYFFYSQGPIGRIRKVIRFRRIRELGVNTYNLAFGDLVESTMELNDRSVTNNNDRLKVLATVAKVVDDFINSRPNAIIYVKGSTLSRIRLYQMAIAAFWLEISIRYVVLGKTKDEWIFFRKGVNFEEFLVYRKIV